MLMRIRRWLAPPVFEGDAEKTRVARLANTILLATAVMINLASLVVVITLRNFVMMAVMYVCLVMPVIVALFILRRGYVRAASLLTSSMLWLVLIVMGVLFGGVVNTSFTTVVIVIMIAALLLGGRAGVIFAVSSFVAVTAVFVSQVLGFLPPPLAPNTPINYWLVHTLNYAIAALLLYLAMGNLTEAIRRAQRFAAESESQRRQLQTLVQERTQDSERNARYLRTTTAVARESAAVMGDPQQLLARVVNVIAEQFGLYHVGLYLLDAAGDWAELRAASSPGGQQLIAQGHRLRVGATGMAEGMIGHVARRGEYHMAVDVRQDAAYRPLAELPDTRSELALPLRARGEVMGVLDIQSAAPQAFGDLDVQTLQALADQVAVAISNARLFEQAQQAAQAERRAYGELTGQAWQQLFQSSQALGFYSNAQATTPAGDLWQPEMRAALQAGSTIQAEQAAQRLAVPVKVRGEVIGVIDFSKPQRESAWSAEEIALVESLTEQLGVALDSARLYQDTQRRAAQERLVGEVTSRMRESLDMETVLKTAAQELRQALGVPELNIRLAAPAQSTADKEASA